MKYAVIQTGGKQYKTQEGDKILVDRLKMKPNEHIDFPQVLLVRTDDNIIIGDPIVKEGKVIGKVLEEVKGEKITIAKFKAKVRYRRKTGFRSLLSQVLIEKISTGKKETVKKATVKKRLDKREKKQ